MILMSKNVKKQIEKYFWPVLNYVKKYAEFNGAVHFAWNLQKDMFLTIFIFYIFYILGVGGIRL